MRKEKQAERDRWKGNEEVCGKWEKEKEGFKIKKGRWEKINIKGNTK